MPVGRESLLSLFPHLIKQLFIVGWAAVGVAGWNAMRIAGSDVK